MYPKELPRIGLKNKNKIKIKMRNKKITISKFHMLIPNTFYK